MDYLSNDTQAIMNAKKLFNEDSKILDHMSFMRFNNEIYWQVLDNIFNKSIELNTLTYSKILAISLQKNDRLKVQYLCNKEEYKLPEILRACEILDSRRMISSLNKKLAVLQKNNTNIKKINKVKTLIANKQTIGEGNNFSLTGSRIKMLVKYWINNINEERLKFYAISYGPKYWRYLLDLLHTKPTDFQLSWFQNYIFTGIAPQDSLISQFKNLNNHNLIDFIQKFKPFYNYIRTIKNITLSNDAKKLISRYTPFETVLYYWNELGCTEVANEITPKINYELKLPYGNLLDNITKMDSYSSLKSKLLEIANSKLIKYKLTIEKPVAILCDGSSSMDIAIKTSAIIASILTAICQAELRVFRDKDELIKNPPRTAQDVEMFSKYCRANNCTNPAASLYPYYLEKKQIKTFIIVTDEEENQKYEGYNFAELFKKYYEQVFTSKLIFITFVKNRNNHMQMINSLKNKINNINENVSQYTFDYYNPDLRRLDNILGQISSLD